MDTTSASFLRGLNDGRGNRPSSAGPLDSDSLDDYTAGYAQGSAQAADAHASLSPVTTAPAQSALVDQHPSGPVVAAEDGLIAVGHVLHSVAAPEGEYLRGMYNEGAKKIAARRIALQIEVDAGRMTEETMARTLSDMRHELAVRVRNTGSALYKKGAEAFDAIRGNVERPTFDSLKAAGRTDAQIIESAAKTNEFINRLPKGLRWAGGVLWVVQGAISVGIIISAPADKRAAVAQAEAEGIIGGVAGASAGEGLCIAFTIATEGWGLIVCGLLGGIAGSEGARRGHLLEMLDIAPHSVPALAGQFYTIQGCWDETDLFIVGWCGKTIKPEDHALVMGTGRVSGSVMGGRGHFRRIEISAASAAATGLLGDNDTHWVNDYNLVAATSADLAAAS